MKKFLSLLLALTLALSIALPAATASADGGVIDDKNDDLAKAWNDDYLKHDIFHYTEGYPGLSDGNFFIAMFTKEELNGKLGVNEDFSIHFSTNSSSDVAGFVGQYVKSDLNSYGINDYWTPIIVSVEFANADNVTINPSTGYTFSESVCSGAQLVGPDSGDGAYIAIGFRLTSPIETNTTVTISLVGTNSGTISSKSHEFKASATQTTPVSDIKIFGTFNNPATKYGTTITTLEQAEIQASEILTARVTGGNGNEAITWSSTNSDVASVAATVVPNTQERGATLDFHNVAGVAIITASIGDVVSNKYVVTIGNPAEQLLVTSSENSENNTISATVKPSGEDTALATVEVKVIATDETDIKAEANVVSLSDLKTSDLVLDYFADQAIASGENEIDIAVVAENVVSGADSITMNVTPYAYINHSENGVKVDNKYLNQAVAGYRGFTFKVKAPEGAEYVDITHTWSADEAAGIDAGSETFNKVPVVDGYATVTLMHFSTLTVTKYTGDAPTQPENNKVNSVYRTYMNLQTNLFLNYQLYLTGDTSSTDYAQNGKLVLSYDGNSYEIDLNSVGAYSESAMRIGVATNGFYCGRYYVEGSPSSWYYVSFGVFPNKMDAACTVKVLKADDSETPLYLNTNTGATGISSAVLQSLVNNTYSTTVNSFEDSLLDRYTAGTADHTLAEMVKAYGVAAAAVFN